MVLLADLCKAEGIPFLLGHALYMNAIHGGKTKNDKIDSEKSARLLRSGMLPQAYVYPREMRATRALLRRRMHLVWLRGESLAHVTNTQYNIGKRPAEHVERLRHFGCQWLGSRVTRSVSAVVARRRSRSRR